MTSFSEVAPASLVLNAESKVIKRKEYTSYLDSRGLIRQAERRAEIILSETETVKNAAREDGYSAGYQAAQQEQSETILKTLGMCQNFLGSRQSDVVDLVLNVTKKVFGRLDDNVVILKLIEQALANYANTQKITLRVSPSQFALVNDNLMNLKQGFPTVYELKVCEDERVDSGSCLLETDIGVVNASVETQLSVIENALRASLDQGERT